MEAATSRTTVVIITYNYGRFLNQAVDSVLAQTRLPRILVMDDASEDETGEVMAAILGREAGRVEYSRSTSNQGLARTRNAGAGMIATDWIVYLDADDWLVPGFIEAGEKQLDAHPEWDALTTDMFIVRGEGRPKSFKAVAPSAWVDLSRRNTVVQTSFIRRAVVLDLGGYDPVLEYEDWDFWIRLLKAGYRIGRLPGEHVFRREHGANKSKVCDETLAEQQIREKHPRIG